MMVSKKVLINKLKSDGLKVNNTIQIVLLPQKDIVTTSNGNTYLQYYLINNTKMPIKGRSSVFSQTKVENQWLGFQSKYPQTCGTLLGKEEDMVICDKLIAHLYHYEYWYHKVFPYSKKQKDAKKTVNFRIGYNYSGKTIYSNEITIEIATKNYESWLKQNNN